MWTQKDGLPQDTIRAIAQTADGYLWLGTDEGLARFDGYEFIVFNKDRGDLPSNSITALAAGRDGGLWIGTVGGLTHYQDRQFRTYTTKQGLPDDAVTRLFEDRSGALWIVAGPSVSRFQDGKFTTFAPGAGIPITSARALGEDQQNNIWVGGLGGVARLEKNKFVLAIDNAALNGNIPASMLFDSHGNLWISGDEGLLVRSSAGRIRRYGVGDGLPDEFVRSLWEDRDGNIWAGTNGGISRLENGRFIAPPIDSSSGEDWVRCIYEDREGNLWVGMNSGLGRFRDDIFTVYSKSEGLPSDEPNAVFQDSAGRIWVGFHDSALALFGDRGFEVFHIRNGLPGNEVFSISQARNGDLLLATREGLMRMRGSALSSFAIPDALDRHGVFAALEDRRGRLWLGGPTGLNELRGRELRNVVAGGSVLRDAVVTICEGSGGAIWAGTYGAGLWRVTDKEVRRFTDVDGLSGDQIQSLYLDRDGALWIGTFGGGLDVFRDGRFLHYTAKDGLLSDNISHVEDDGYDLWLSTTRGICRIPKQQLRDFDSRKIHVLTPINYGVEDGLRSAQCAPGYPTGGGGTRTSDGRLWFPTTRGLAVLEPNMPKRTAMAPIVHVVEVIAGGRSVDLDRASRLAPGTEPVQIRYTGIHLSAPERVRYSYKLEGLDQDWVSAGSRRAISYSRLPHGRYRFLIKAELPGGRASEQSYTFELLPEFYETAWFRILCVALLIAGAWAAYRLRLRQIRGRFALVLEERARLAREIHDTLAQAFVGISSQLDAVAMCMSRDAGQARQYLDLARKMARHSLTEARRSVMDLRASALQGQDLAAALQSGARVWTAGSGVDVEVDVSGPQSDLPEEMEQHLLRIAQEAVTNVLKHARASKIWVRLHLEARKIFLRIVDNGAGFEQRDAFSSLGGHFGLLGMRERAERLGGELRLQSRPGQGTQVEVMVPLP